MERNAISIRIPRTILSLPGNWEACHNTRLAGQKTSTKHQLYGTRVVCSGLVLDMVRILILEGEAMGANGVGHFLSSTTSLGLPNLELTFYVSTLLNLIS